MDIDRDAAWYHYLTRGQQVLVDTSLDLSKRRQQLLDLKDYSFIVFPMAKAYEGFLKKVLFDLYLIDQVTYQGRRFRIGRALNPDVRAHQRDEQWLYDDLSQRFGADLTRQLWDTWLKCRNRIFHFFPDKEQYLSLQEAEAHLLMMVEVMSLIVANLEKRDPKEN